MHIESLEEAMNKCDIKLDSSFSDCFSHGHALLACIFCSMQYLLLFIMSGLLIMGHPIIWTRIKSFISSLNEFKSIDDDTSLSIVFSTNSSTMMVIEMTFYVFKLFSTHFYEYMESLIHGKVKW